MHPKLVIERDQFFDSIGYEPHDGQRAFHESDAKNRVATTGWGWGKSHALAREIELMLLSPRTLTWIVGPDYGEAAREFSIVWDDLVTRLALPFAEKHYLVDQGKMRLRTPDEVGGSVLEVKTERNPHSLEGPDVDLMAYAEAGQLKQRTYQRCQGRLRMGGYQVAAFTPEGFNWAFDDLWEPTREKDDWWGHRGPSWENPYIDADWLEDMKSRLSPAMYEAKIEGRFRTNTGFVFPDFDPDVHMAELGGIVPGRPIFGAVDFGYTNPTVVLTVQVNEHDQICVLREYYKSFVTQEDHAAEVASWGVRWKRILGDPAGADAIATWRKLKLPIEGVQCEVETGNELINQLLQVRDDGRPGLVFDTSCVNAKREMTKYRWGPSRDDLNAKEAPVKAHDHIPEALKRFVSWYFGVKRRSDVKPRAYGERTFKGARMPRDSI